MILIYFYLVLALSIMNRHDPEVYSTSDGLDFLTSSDDANEEQEVEEEQEERECALPPLPPVPIPQQIRGIPTSDLYQSISELRKRVDDEEEREKAKKVLQGDVNVLLAVVQVLQESQLLYRREVSADGKVTHEKIPQPTMPRPSLPSGYNSWIVE